MRIVITGAQGVGKTTLTSELKKLLTFKDYVLVPSAREKLKALNLSHSESATEETQRVYMRHYLEFNDATDAIFDRGVYDVLAYTTYLAKNNKLSEIFYAVQEQIVENYAERFRRDDFVFLIEPEFEIVTDGLRSTSKEFQTELTENIRDILNQNRIHYFAPSGSVEDRVRYVANALE